MEYIINYYYIFLIIIGFIVGGYTVLNIIELKRLDSRRKNKDKTIEWYGPDIYLREKQYQNPDKFFEELTDQEKYKNAETKRIENVRNNTGDSSTNKVNGTGFSNNNSEDENKRT